MFAAALSTFAETLKNRVSKEDAWTIKGFIDIFKQIRTISADTKVISKILELQLFPYFLEFAQQNNYRIVLASCQNWYPDLSFVKLNDERIKFAVDLKTTYRLLDNPEFCNGFTLGSHGDYFKTRGSTKNIQYPYNDYLAHFCLGIIYSRELLDKKEEFKEYAVEQIDSIPSVIKDFVFFAQEKWRIASDKSGSGNTANIGSINKISDILNGRGVFCRAGEEHFYDYWCNFGELNVPSPKGGTKKLSSFCEFLEYKNLPGNLYNPKAITMKRAILNDGE